MQAHELAEEIPVTSVTAASRSTEVNATDLKERTVRGGVAKIGAQGVTFILRISSLMILARILDPRDFGLVAMVTVVTGVFALFKDAGLGMATIQKATVSEEELSALFWVNIVVGLVLMALTIGLSPAMAAFYDEPKLIAISCALAVGFLLTAAGVQHSALLQRHMRFTALSTIDVVAQVSSTAIGIGMAVAGYGYWSLVVMALMLPGISALGVWWEAKWTPGPPSWPAEVRAMVGFGGKVTLNGLIVYVAYNMDKVLLGRLAGAEVLGLYGRAYQLINIPTENLNTAVGGVTVSALSRLQDDSTRFRSYFLKAYAIVLALTIPVTVACALFANEFVYVLLGPKWSAAASIFRLLAPTIVAFALINPVTWVLFSTNKVDRSLRMAMVIAPLIIAAEVVGVQQGGAVGIALGYSAIMALLAAPLLWWATYDSVVAPKDIVAVATPPSIAIAIATAATLVIRLLVGSMSTPVVNLALYGGILLGVYASILLSLTDHRALFAELLRELKAKA